MNRFRQWLRPSLWGLRIRSALVSALAVGVVLVIAACAMLWLLNRSLVDELDSAAASRATELAGLLAPDPGRIAALPRTEDGRIAAAQVVGGDGSPIWGFNDGHGRLADPPAGVDRAEGLPASTGYRDDFRVASRRVGAYQVLVAVDTESVERAVAQAGLLLAIGAPVVVLAAAAATYLLVGRSLRSVEAIRNRVARIGATQLSERVPVPPPRDEIARLAETMNDMLARVEAGHRAQRRFVGDASHELRSPLATVTAALELARDRPEALDAELIDGTLLPEAQRMRRLIEDLLTLAAADERGLELHTGDVDLDDLAHAAATSARLRGDITVDTAIRPVRMVGDPDRLARALRNIVDNAVAHARARVRVATEAPEGRARVVVDDDGPGIPIADRERIFRRFVRLEADRSRTTTGGSGLGLAIVTEIVGAHGGAVLVGESPWGGARFVVDLPMAPSEGEPG
ncbi:sensor histidine kinase [Nocardia spumae]|uniref:sensor histidine kinase n=1 Tax=Nocardia spumae TaxID=2887190 RepID=UPI001D1439D5|nr:HAMP domain-containing sensor histidine kinase [Nocardia spumae]